jgi:hypothetical protein
MDRLLGSELNTFQPPRSQPMDWRDLAHLTRTFGLPKLVEISGISKDRIQGWQRIGAWPVERLGRGNVRRYSIWDAVRAAIIREFSDAGLPISAKGQELTSALVGAVIYAARTGPGDLSRLAEQVKLYRDPDGEWCIDLSGDITLDDERLGTFVVLIRLRRIAFQIGERVPVATAA